MALALSDGMRPWKATPPQSRRVPMWALALLLLCSNLFASGIAVASSGFLRILPREEVLRFQPRTFEEATQMLAARAARHRSGLNVDQAFVTSASAASRLGEWSEWVTPGASTVGDASNSHPGSLGIRIWHSLVVEPASRRLIVFGGWVPGPAPTLVMVRPLDGSADWAALAAASPEAPSQRFLHGLAHDPVRDQLVLFGGQAVDGTGSLLGDLWRLPLSAGGVWERLVVPGGPGPRRLMSFCFDAARDRFLVAGGDDLTSTHTDVWELKLGATPSWRELGTRGDLGLPYGEFWSDPIRGDGWVLGSGPLIHHLTFSTDSVIGERVELDPIGFEPVAPVVFDAQRQELLGFPADGSMRHRFAEPRSLALGAGSRWIAAGIATIAPGARLLSEYARDPAADRLLMVGGYDDGDRYFADTWQLQWQVPVPVAASLVRGEANGLRTRIEWLVSGAAGVRGVVERSDDGVAWSERGEARFESADLLVFEDSPLRPGSRAAYRLRMTSGGESSMTSAAWVERAALSTALELSIAENPVRGPVRLRIALAGDGPATLELFDATGRRINHTRVESSRTDWSLPAPAAPGLYLARLQQGGETRMVKLAVSR